MPGPTTGERIHGYLRPEAFTRRVERAAARAGSRAELEVIGSSVERRSLRAVIVAGKGSRPSRHRPQASVLAGVHGSEVVSSELALRLLEMACAAERTGPVADLLAVADLAVVPCVNPDGRARAMHGLEQSDAWRPMTRGNANGVDLDRNWAGSAGPASRQRLPAPVDGLLATRGRTLHPLSEPETRAVDRFLSDRRPFVLLDLHAPGQTITHRSDATAGSPDDADRFRAVAAAFTANQSSGRYRTSGTRAHARGIGGLDDHAHRCYGSLAVTIAIGRPSRSPVPLWARRAFWRVNPVELEPTLANDADACFSAMRAAYR